MNLSTQAQEYLKELSDEINKTTEQTVEYLIIREHGHLIASRKEAALHEKFPIPRSAEEAGAQLRSASGDEEREYVECSLARSGYMVRDLETRKPKRFD